MSDFELPNMVPVKLCGCDGDSGHEEFIEVDYQFPDGSTETLPALCPNSDLYPEELSYQFRPVVETLESDQKWTLDSYIVGLIREVRPGLYFYSFGDIDEIGERNFYIQSELEPVVDMLLEEWGPSARVWEIYFKDIGQNGYPEDYEPGTLVDITFFIPDGDAETHTVGISYNRENKELLQIFRSL
jgi:hypothetical protein